MKKVAISGASGDLGQQITALLLERIPAHNIVLGTRTPDKLAAARARGASVFASNHRDAASLDAAYAGCDTLMLISGLDVSNRIPEHRNAIEAAKRAGIQHIVYTSVAGIHPHSPILSCHDHLATERMLAESGLSFTALRNASYSEIFPILGASAIRDGEYSCTEGEGRLAPVSKQDISRCAVECLLHPEKHGHGTIYEITGPALMTFREMVAIMSEVYGRPIKYVTQPVEQRYEHYDAKGIPRHYSPDMAAHPDAHFWASDEMVSAEVGITSGYHEILTGHVKLITGRNPISFRAVLEADRDSRGG